ncbi:MAG: NERD domain-containing protein [Xanthomonadaceae bacterium]|nr:NERD domain-containing protein [Xanthomonadaceae bacterium]
MLSDLPQWTSWAIPGALAVAGLATWLVMRRRRSYRWRLRAVLRAHGDALLRDLLIPDGLDGQIHVSHILRTDAGFVVVDVVPVAGAVFGAPSIDEWTVMAGRRAHKFRNPVASNRSRVLAVRSLVPGVPVHGLVVLLGPVSFPKGTPQATVTIDTLGEALDALLAAPPGAAWDDAWYGLAACAARVK